MIPDRLSGKLVSNRGAGDSQQMTRSEVALYKHAHSIAAEFLGKLPRRGPRAALEFETNHPGPAANISLGHRARMRVTHRVECVFRFHVKPVDIVQVAIPGLGHYRKRPPIFLGNGPTV